MKSEYFAFLLLLVACQSTAPHPVAAGAPPANIPPEIAKASELPSNAGGCNDFYFYAADSDRKRVLRIHVDVRHLALEPGRHTLGVLDKRNVSVELVEYQTPPSDLPDCNDVGQPGLVVRETWNAESGELLVDIPKLPAPHAGDTSWTVTVELVNVTLKNSKGERRTYSKRYEPVQVGWLPG